MLTTTHRRTTKFHWVLLFAGLGSGFNAQAGNSADGTVGESDALSYHTQHLDRFMTDAPTITPALAAAALAQGQLDEMLASAPPNRFLDTQGEAQATRYFAKHRAEFASPFLLITLAQASAASTEGQLSAQVQTAMPGTDLSAAAE